MLSPLRSLLVFATLLLCAASARAETFVLQVPISGDVVAVTLEIVDAPGGGGVDFAVSVPPGEGDLLGLFGNVVDESLVGQLSVDNPTGILTQWQFKKNKVWKVGGGNVMAPVKKWDWGLRIGQNGSAGGAVEQASFGLRAPGLDVAQVLNAVNQGWVFGVRVQGTSGSEGSSKMGLPDGQPPVGNAPTVTIDQPPDGTITNQTPATIVGTVTGSPTPTVDVNGQATVVTGESFTLDLALAEGSNTVTATATNSQGTASDAIAVVLDTIVPVVTINVPADGTNTTDTNVLVEGTVADANPIASFQIEGVDVPLTAGAFSTTVTIPTEQATAIDAVAVDAAGNVGSASVTVTHGTAPGITITGPADATRTAGNAVLVTGTVTGSGDPAVDVNGTPVTVSGGSFSLNLPLALGDNTVTATATSAFGSASDAIMVFRGELPTVAISAPSDGLLTSAATVSVSGTASGLPEPAVDVNGIAAPLTGGAFTADVPLAEGANALVASAANEFGTATATVNVTRDSLPPAIVFQSPADGSATTPASVAVALEVTDASAVTTVSVNGTTATLTLGLWEATVALAAGDNTLIADATDAAGNTGNTSISVRRLSPPGFTSTPPTTVDERATYTYDAEASDPDAGDTLTFSLETAPAGMSVDPATGLVSWTPGAADLGANPVTLRVTDPAGLFAEQSFTLTVLNVNDPPAFTSTAPTTVDERATYTYDAEASDPDAGDTLTFSLGFAPTGMTIDAATGLVQWPTTSADLGNHPVVVRVTDAGGLFAEQSFTVSVLNVNDPPEILSAPPLQVNEQEAWSYPVLALDPDAGDTVTLSLELAPAGMTLDPITDTAFWTPTAAQIGLHDVVLRATDAGGLFVEQSFTVTVSAVNEPPAFTSTPPTTVDERQTYTYAATASDPDAGDTLGFSLTSAPAGMTVAAATGQVDWPTTSADLGDHPVTLRVTDAAGLFAEQSFTVSVLNVNDPPVFDWTPVTTVAAGADYADTALANDPDPGDVLAFSITGAPAGLTLDAATGALAWTGPTPGDYPLTVRVTDAGGLFAEFAFTLTVIAPESPPSITSEPRTLTVPDVEYAYEIAATDPNPGDTLSYALDAAPTGMTIDAGTGVVVWTPATADLGSHPVAVRVTDSTGRSDSQAYDLGVSSPPSAAFTVRRGRDWTDPALGAAIAEFSSRSGSGSCVQPENLLLDSCNWRTASASNEFVTIDLVGDQPVVIRRVEIESFAGGEAPRNVELRVSTTGIATTDFTTVLATELPDGGDPVALDLPEGTSARYLQLFIFDNYGGARVSMSRIKAVSRERSGGVVSMIAGGAAIAEVSSEFNTTRTADQAFDFPTFVGETFWRATACAGEFVTVELADGKTWRTGRIDVFQESNTGAITDFELAVSSTGLAPGDFTTVASGSAPVAQQRAFFFEETGARYVRLTALDCTNSSADARLYDLQVTTPQTGGLTVGFDDLSEAATGEIVAWEWFFGDGGTSSAASPLHTFTEPGSYPVTLTVTDALGMRGTTTLEYTAVGPAAADFTFDPDPTAEQQNTSYTDVSTPAEGGLITGREWDFDGTAFRQLATTRNFTYPQSGLRPTSVTVFDGQLLGTTEEKLLPVENLPPTLNLDVDAVLVWGQPWQILDDGAINWSDVSADSVNCRVDYGDGAFDESTAQCTQGFLGGLRHAFALPAVYEPLFTFTDEDGAAISDTAVVNVLPRDTNLVLCDAPTVTAAGQATVEAQLVDHFDPSENLAGRTIEFRVGAQVAAATTDATGLATATLDFVESAPNTLTASFGGDGLYHPTVGSETYPAISFPGTAAIASPPAPDSRGNEFVLGFNEVLTVGGGAGVIFLESDRYTTATVEVPGLGIEQRVELVPGQVSQVVLPPEIRTRVSGRIDEKGIRVTGKGELRVHALNFQDAEADGYLALPTDVLGTEHVVLSYRNRGSFGIVAVEDGTTVTVVPNAVLTAGPDTPANLDIGIPFDLSLDALDAIELDASPGQPTPSDPTGTRIFSDKPIVVYGFHQCVGVPPGTQFCNHLVEQLPPVSSWGSEFLVAPLADRLTGHLLRVVANDDGTVVSVDGTPVATLAAGEHVELDQPQAASVVSTSAPVLVAQYSKSGFDDGTRRDPFMSLVVPTEQFPTEHRVSSVAAAIKDYDDRLAIIAPTAEVGGIRVNGAPVTDPWNPIGTSTHAYAQVTVPSGANQVTHVNNVVPFMVYAYGWEQDDAYGYPAGMRLLPLDAPCLPSGMTAGDGLDNDCDGRVDEELGNGIDDDGDSVVDEDLAYAAVAVNLPPVAYERSASVREDTPRVIVLSGFDPNGDALTFEIVTPPASGTLSGTPPVVTYTPAAQFNGADAFSYRVSDGSLFSGAATVSVNVATENDAPEITSSAPTTATENAPYTYAATATDIDGDTGLVFSLTAAPAGMTVDPATGLVSWTPGDAQTGAQNATLRVTDPGGLFGEQSFTVTVANVNDPPEITSTPPVGDAVAGAPYVYDVAAADPDPGETLTFTLDTAPAGMTIDSGTGLVAWTPGTGQTGSNDVTVRVSDAAGAADTQSFAIPVVADTFAPIVAVSVQPGFVALGQSATITVVAIDEVAVAQTNLTVNDVPVPLDGNGQAVYTPATGGAFVVRASALDPSGNLGTDATVLGVLDPADVDPPTVNLASPEYDSTHTLPTDVVGTVDDANVLFWELRIGRVNDPESDDRVIAEGLTPEIDAVLGTFDPTLLENGRWRITLEAEDVNGATAEDEIVVQVDGGAKIGVLSLSFVDLEIPLAGIPISVIRTYDSRVKTKEDFGVGWRLSFGQGSVEHNRTPGEGWGVGTSTKPFSFPCQIVQEQQSHVTEVRLSEREYYLFRPTLANTFPFSGGCRGDVFYDQVGGSAPGATLDVLGNIGIRAPGGLIPTGGTLPPADLTDEITNQVWKPDTFRLRTADGRTFDLTLKDGILRVEDRNANELYFLKSGILHSTGVAVAFERDTEGRITRIVDPMGNDVHYAYEGAGDLVAVTNQVEATTSFEYEPDIPHHLAAIIDPLGRRTATAEYDADGRLTAIRNGLGEGVELEHDLPGRREITYDALGNPTERLYDARGNVTQVTDALGEVQSFTYDALDNVLTQTDEASHTRIMAYDASSNLLSVTDAKSQKTVFGYDAGNRLLTMTDPRGATTTHEYDASGNLERSIDALGNDVEATYDARGQITSLTDRNGHVTSFEYDVNGHLTRRTDGEGAVAEFSYDPLGRLLTETTWRTDDQGTLVADTTTHVYDALGRQIATIDPAGNTSTTEYDLLGQRIATTDPLGARTEFEYDLAGRLVRTIHPDGTDEVTTYDAEGRTVTQRDRAGFTTSFTYDALGRLTRTDFPDGTFTRSEYDPRGLLTASIDETGARSEQDYDEIAQLTASRNGLGDAATFEYDATGNRTRILDPLARQTVFTFDLLGRNTQTTFDDGTFSTNVFDAEGLLTRTVDANGHPTDFEYDANGRLTKVIDALGGETVYVYDETGNRTAQTDANLHTTAWAYDGLGRVVRHTLPLGMARTFDYDAAGNRTLESDFEGLLTERDYDLLGRVTERRVPGEAPVTFTYTDDGLRETVTDARGTTSYQYDQRRRLTRVDHPEGTYIAYTYDPAGRVASIETPGGTTLQDWDAAGRLETLTDRDGGQITASYDAAGNRTSLARPNGTTTFYGYDALHRMVDVQHRAPDTTLFARFEYTLDPAGNRLTVDELDGRQVAYTYDALHRLTREASTGGLIGLRTIDHAYDPVGNRTLQTIDGVPEAATFDANDRILTQGAATYAYDGDGNTLSRSDGSGTTTYGYDELNRLTSVSGPNGTASYAYDADGNRVETVGASTTRYLVDTNRQFAQVIEERDGLGALGAHYTWWGREIQRQDLAGTVSHHHADAHTSVRNLTGSSGVGTAQFGYDAYGGLLAQSGSSSSSYRYAGEAFASASDSYYLRARYYQPGVGRFMTRDSFAGLAKQPITLNKYLYANGNPVTGLDPSGQITMLEIQAAQVAISRLRVGLAFASQKLIAFVGPRLLAIGGSAALAALGPRVPQLLRGSGERGVTALQGTVRVALRAGQSISQSAARQAHYLGRDTRVGLNRLLGFTRNPPDIQYHHLVSQFSVNLNRFGSRAINSLSNVVPTPALVHDRISAFYRSTTQLRAAGESMQRVIARLPYQEQWRIGAEVWSKAMGLNGAPVRFAQLPPTVQQAILRATTLPPVR